MVEPVRQQIKPRLITFDFGDTLVTSAPPYLERIALGLVELGFARSAKEVMAAFHRSDLKHSARMLQRAPFDNAAFQTGFAETLFDELNLSGDQAELYQQLSRWLIDFRPRRELMPGAGELLDRLKRRGYRLGVISNNDGNTRQKCAEVDIETYFEFILDSTLEGVMKPDGRIFAKALKLGAAPAEETLHVGDLWGCDILGAHAAGLWAAWLSNPYVSPDPVDRVWTLDKLLDLLEFLPK